MKRLTTLTGLTLALFVLFSFNAFAVDPAPGTDTTIPSFIDADGDGINLPLDNCPVTSNALQQDQDGDGVGDACDTCTAVFSPDQSKTDGDGMAEGCDNDDDTVGGLD